MDTIYIGVDFHARQQTICYLKTETGELVTCELKHQDKQKVRAFYAEFQGQAIVGLEASGYSPWFERLLEELSCEVWLGHATEIRRRARWRQKNDRGERTTNRGQACDSAILNHCIPSTDSRSYPPAYSSLPAGASYRRPKRDVGSRSSCSFL